jgi:hypothetical protein
MKKVLAGVVLSTLMLGAVAAFAADMTSEERSELRTRAQTLQAQRAQNGGEVRSDGYINHTRSDLASNDSRHHVKQVKTGKGKKAKNPK